MAYPADIINLLDQGLSQLGLDFDKNTRSRLLQFVELLQKWNRTYNLTAIKQPEEMITKHILDSLAVLPYVNGPRILDVGTGPGIPGIPLALAMPEHSFVLLDSNNKKTRFITQAITELGIDNVQVVTARIENYEPEIVFNTVIARAYTSLENLIQSSGHCCTNSAQILAMKGLYPATELQHIPESYSLNRVIELQVPGLDVQRHLVVIQKLAKNDLN